ncbi:hypothetical protein [Absidia glauca]|uniref:Protein SCAI n=1 Tax=Absidia glauca TaxID=4829 RepID=A0A163JZZ0_ABSGL|nr:hypothetical protein [Absidia glauca]
MESTNASGKPTDGLGTPVGQSSLSTATDVNAMTEAPSSTGMTLDSLSNITKTNTGPSLPTTAPPAPATAPLPTSSPLFTPATSEAPTSVPIESTTSIDESNAIQNQKYVEEFQYFLEKSQSLFSGLRDLPPTGSHRQWRPYFEKTFEVYTKLWKFQQAHRSLLEEKSNYGLKRWEVGEIASKIGQLYYHYYLRTSETNYLNEAYVFYEAIHDRQYFKNILEVKNPALMIKKMRYYARFIVVCLLLNKDENIRLLIGELELLIDEYTKTFKPLDAKEWQMVLQEIMTFMDAEKKLVPINADRTQVPIQHRLPSQQLEKPHGLRLQEAILVGNYQNQIKFSELTLDMYRMLQSLEREPMASSTSSNKPNTKDLQQSRDHTGTTTSGTTTAVMEKKDQTKESTGTLNSQSPTTTNYSSQQQDKASHASNKRTNPHKYLLYRPSLSQLLVYITTAFKDTGDSAVMLLYISADGCVNETSRGFGFGGGVSTSQRNPSSTVANSSNNTANTNTSNNLANTSNTSSSISASTNNNSTNNTASNSTPGNNATGNNQVNSNTADINAANITGNSHGNGGATGATSSGPLNDATQPSGPSATNDTNNQGSTTTTTEEPSSSIPKSSNIHSTQAVTSTSGANNTTAASTTTASAATTTAATANPASTPVLVPPAISACLYPADLIPFTRKPLFLIVDSNNSTAFQQMSPNLFDQPLMCLLSPTMYPSSVQDKSEIGSLFTLFLHTPLLAFCSVSDIGNLDQDKWDACIQKVAHLERAIGKSLLGHPDLDTSVKRFMTDDFLWTFIVRFVLCGIILRCHSSFKNEKSYPTSQPSVPEVIYTLPDIMVLFNELTVIADVSTYFHIPLPTVPAASPSTPANLTTGIASPMDT